MFRDRHAMQPRTGLQLIHGGRRDTTGTAQGEKKMNNYRFAQYPASSSIASGVTLLVSAWFLVASGAILAEPTRYAQPVQATAAAPAKVAIAPEARVTITVEASRSATL
jgi:hypothetical protein